MSIGWLLFKTECKIKMNTVIWTRIENGICFFLRFELCVFFQLTVVTGWTVSSAMLTSLIFSFHQVELHPIVAAAYSSLSHTLWALCLSWTVIACATGHGGNSRCTTNYIYCLNINLVTIRQFITLYSIISSFFYKWLLLYNKINKLNNYFFTRI
jgi:hypothetical protein